MKHFDRLPLLGAAALVFPLLAFAPLAEAHPLAAHTDTLAAFLHPFSGVDHLLAMVLIGLWAGRSPARARWQAPISFLVGLTAGAVLAVGGFTLPGGEAAIAVSLLLLGPLAARAAGLPGLLTLACGALAGLVHGQAHGLELGVAGGVLPAFLCGSLLLHALGFAMARRVERRGATRALRLALNASALAGAWLLAAG
ncbi:MAG: HupE/UreJ family protein [Gammaproteobacteria bacterium]